MSDGNKYGSTMAYYAFVSLVLGQTLSVDTTVHAHLRRQHVSPVIEAKFTASRFACACCTAAVAHAGCMHAKYHWIMSTEAACEYRTSFRRTDLQALCLSA